jgi:hypothetical protein
MLSARVEPLTSSRGVPPAKKDNVIKRTKWITLKQLLRRTQKEVLDAQLTMG